MSGEGFAARRWQSTLAADNASMQGIIRTPQVRPAVAAQSEDLTETHVRLYRYDQNSNLRNLCTGCDSGQSECWIIRWSKKGYGMVAWGDLGLGVQHGCSWRSHTPHQVWLINDRMEVYWGTLTRHAGKPLLIFHPTHDTKVRMAV